MSKHNLELEPFDQGDRIHVTSGSHWLTTVHRKVNESDEDLITRARKDGREISIKLTKMSELIEAGESD